MSENLRVLFLTSQWPTPENPSNAPFVKREVEALRQTGVHMDVFIYAGGWNPLRYIRAIRQLHRKLREDQFDLIHVRFGQCGLVARAQRRLPIVITYGGSDIEATAPPDATAIKRIQYRILRMVSRNMARWVDEVIVVADHLGQKLPRPDYHVIPSGLDLSLFRPIEQTAARQQLNLPKDKKLVAFIANPKKPIKRFSLAEQTCQIAQQSIPDLELLIVHGRPAEEIPIYMNACDALLLTSTNEGSPNVVKEALACNLPVVSVDIGDVHTHIKNIPGCVLCEDDSPQTIANGLVSILRKPTRLSVADKMTGLDNIAQAKKIIAVYQATLSR